MHKYQLRQLPLTVAVSSVLAAGSLQAATITVDSAQDAPVGTYTSDCTLRAAIEAANTDAVVDGCIAGDAGLDAIVFDPSLVNSTITIANPDTPFEVSSSLSINGPIPGDYDALVIDGGGVSQVFRVIGAVDAYVDVQIDSLTVSGGFSTTIGGGVFCSNCDLMLIDSLVSSNYTQSDWGGIGAINGSLSLANTVVSENIASGRAGGIGLANGALTVDGGRITGNVGQSAHGGLYIGFSDAVFNSSLVSGNQSGGGSGIFVSSANVTISQSAISNNVVDGGAGFGIGFGGTLSEVNIVDSNFSFNEAISKNQRIYGAGIGLANSSLTVSESVIEGNYVNSSSASGGGLFLRNVNGEIRNTQIVNNRLISTSLNGFDGGGGIHVNSGTVAVSESEISNNSADGLTQRGSAVRVDTFAGLSMTNVTVSGNQLINSSASYGTTGFAIDVSGTGSLELTHVTMTENSSSLLGQAAIYASNNSTVDLTNSLISETTSGAICSRPSDLATATLVTDSSCTGLSTSEASLALLPLADNGGSIRTHAIERGSIAVDAAGDCSAIGVLTDQRGFTRDPLCDIGAFELPEVFFEDRFELQP